MNRNLFSCVRFLPRSVLLVCTAAMEQESEFLTVTVNMLFVSMRKGWKGISEVLRIYHNVRINVTMCDIRS